MSGFDLPGMLRRIRRSADLSQRELARHIDASKTSLAAAESGTAGLDARTLARAAAVARMRLVLVDEEGAEVTGMADDAVRDMAGRRFPAHLDTRYGDDGWWYDVHRYDRPRPWYTFDRARRTRDEFRRRSGTPEDHQLPQPGDAPEDRAAARRQEHWRRRAEERQRRFLAGEFSRLDDMFDCTCLPGCDDLDEQTGELTHTQACPCLCDLA